MNDVHDIADKILLQMFRARKRHDVLRRGGEVVAVPTDSLRCGALEREGWEFVGTYSRAIKRSALIDDIAFVLGRHEALDPGEAVSE
jgi:hypothetical protein